MVYDGRYARLYVDGSLKAANDAGGNFPIQYAYPSNSALIGADPSTGSTPEGEYLAGSVDEVRVYRRALTVTDIRELHGGGPYERLEAYYPMDGNTIDLSDYGRNATNHGATVTADALGREQRAFAFNGTDVFIDLGGNPAFRPTDGLSAQVWACRSNWQTDAGAHTLIGDSQLGGWCIVLENNELRGYVHVAGEYRVTAVPLTERAAGWHHVVLTYDGYTACLYVDAVLKSDVELGANLPIYYKYANHALVGAEAETGATPNSQYCDGSLDEVRIYNYALSPASISQLYAEMSAMRVTAISVGPTGVALEWLPVVPATGYVIRGSHSLALPLTNWIVEMVVSATNRCTVPASGETRFYRMEAVLPP